MYANGGGWDIGSIYIVRANRRGPTRFAAGRTTGNTAV